jgi:hypothetical protein
MPQGHWADASWMNPVVRQRKPEFGVIRAIRGYSSTGSEISTAEAREYLES